MHSSSSSPALPPASAAAHSGAPVAVLGAGYVGLVAAACFAGIGHRVALHDASASRMEQLRSGRIPIVEPGLDEMFGLGVGSGRLRLAGSVAEAAGDARFVVLAVGTPSGPHGVADLSALVGAVHGLAPHLPWKAVLVTKSTVPVGTGDLVEELLAGHGRSDVAVVSNPEFLREGSAIGDFMRPDRVVIGGQREAAQAVAGLYAALDAPLILTDRRSAEMAKYACNAFLATRISFINEVAAICERVGVDATVVASVMGADHRIGPHFLAPGAGYGGSCFPKDLIALVRTAERAGCHPELLRAVIAVNRQLRATIVNRLSHELGGLRGRVVAVLGLAFKPNTDDVREAPALEVAQMLAAEGCAVRGYDPVAGDQAAAAVPELHVTASLEQAVGGSDAVVVMTEWDEFRRLDLHRLRALMRGNLLVDGRNVFDAGLAAAAGFRHRGVGIPARDPAGGDAAGEAVA